MIATEISEIATPIVEEITKDMVKDFDNKNDKTQKYYKKNIKLRWKSKFSKVEEFFKNI